MYIKKFENFEKFIFLNKFALIYDIIIIILTKDTYFKLYLFFNIIFKKY